MGMDDVFKSVEQFDREMRQVPELGVSDAYERRRYDDIAKRRKYQNDIFGDKKTHDDYLTGNTLHKNAKMARNKYKGNATQHSGDMDHITPIAYVHSVARYIPVLTDEDIKQAVNREANLRLTPASINRAKGDKTNFSAAVDSVRQGDIGTAVKQVGDGVVSAASVGTELAARASVNTGEYIVKSTYKHAHGLPGTVTDGMTAAGKGVETAAEGAAGALESAEVYLAVAAAQNLVLLSQGKISKKEAAKNMVHMTAGIARYGATERLAAESLKQIAANTKNQLAKTALHSNVATQVGVVAATLAISVIASVCNGEEIDSEQLFHEVFDNTLGSFTGILEIAGALLPIPGVSEVIAAGLLVTSVCSLIYSICNTEMESTVRLDRRAARVRAIEQQALREMAYQRDLLHSLIEADKQEWNDHMEAGFEAIFAGALANDVEAMAGGLDRILVLMHKEVKFKTLQEFDAFFMDENAVLKM